MTTVRVNRKPPLTFAALEPVVRGSRVAASLQRLAVPARVLEGARVAALATRAARLKAQPLDHLVRSAAWVVAIAALTHIAMLLFVERYHFPNRAALLMPVAAAVAAMAAIPLSGHLARAMMDRRRS